MAKKLNVKSDGNLCFIEDKKGGVGKYYMKGFMHENNDWDHDVEGNAVDNALDYVGGDEVVQALNEMKTE